MAVAARLIGRMITQKMKYALKALTVLADERAGDGEALRIEEIARRSGTPKRFLEHILLEIRNAGFIALDPRPQRRLLPDQGARGDPARASCCG